MIARLLASALVLASLAPSAARACSCVSPRMQRVVLPADGASGFPTDGVIRVFLTGGFPEPLRAAIASEYRLRDPGGALVPLDAHVVGTRLDLRPRGPLAPSARYTLESVFAYDPSGVQVSDTDRWNLTLRGSSAALRGAWFPVAFFETGSGPRSARSIAPQITRARTHFAMGGGDCGPGVAVTADVQLPIVTETDVLELRVRGAGVVATLPASGAAHVHASDMLCDPDPVSLRARAGTEIELALVDASGAELGTSGWTRAAGSPNFTLDPRWHRGRRSASATPEDRIAVAQWTAIAITNATPAQEPGPSGCPYGLELRATNEAAPSGGPWMYEAHSSLTSSGASAWMAVADPQGTARVLRIGADASARPIAASIAGIPAIGASDARTTYFVTRTYPESGAPEASLHALVGGTWRWSRPVREGGDYFRVAAGDGRVLVSWLGSALVRQVAWATFDEASGAPIGGVTETSHAAHTNGGLASAFVRDHFVVAWPEGQPATVRVAVVSRDGAEMRARDLGVSDDGPLDLASTGARVALVTDSDGEIAWHLLDESGAIVRGPVIVSAGIAGRDNRKPRIAWNGEVFAIAWETHPSMHTFVAVIDEAGRVAPALALAPGLQTCTAGIAAIGRSFVASYTQDPYESAHAMTAALSCRATPPAGAPQRIRPSR